MNSKEIRKAAKKLRWGSKDVEHAFDEFLETDSLLEQEELINVCLESGNPDERFARTGEYFLRQRSFKGRNPDRLVDLISDLLMNDDPCFRMIALFNIYDFYIGKEEINIPARKPDERSKLHIVKFKRPESRISWNLAYTRNHKSFLHWDTHPDFNEFDEGRNRISLSYSIEEHRFGTLEDISHNPAKLKYKFLDLYIGGLRDMQQLSLLFPEPTSYLDALQPLFKRVVERVGYLAFSIEAFRREVNYFCRLPDFKESRMNLEKLNDAIVPTAKTKISQTERRNWLWYVLMEELLQRRYGVRAAGRKAVEILGESTENAMTRNFYEMKEKASKEGMTLDEIIRKNHLSLELREFMVKAGIIEEESFFLFDLSKSEDNG